MLSVPLSFSLFLVLNHSQNWLWFRPSAQNWSFLTYDLAVISFLMVSLSHVIYTLIVAKKKKKKDLEGNKQIGISLPHVSTGGCTRSVDLLRSISDMLYVLMLHCRVSPIVLLLPQTHHPHFHWHSPQSVSFCTDHSVSICNDFLLDPAFQGQILISVCFSHIYKRHHLQ